MTDAFVEVDKPEQNKEEEETTTSTGHKMFWKLDYYQQFFNVTTRDVGHRILSSMVPNRKGFIDVISSNPDLYGPLWVCVTLIVTASMSGNIAKYFGSRGQSNWTFHFQEVTSLATILFIYTWIVPILLWAVLAWRVGQANTHSLFSMITLYGYSLAIFIPVSILWTVLIHFASLQWIITLAAAALSGGVLAISFWPVIKRDKQKIAYGVIAAIVLLHLVLAVGFQLYFFRSVSSSPIQAVQHSNGVNVSPSDIIDKISGQINPKGVIPVENGSGENKSGQKQIINLDSVEDTEVEVNSGIESSRSIKERNEDSATDGKVKEVNDPVPSR